MRAQHLFVFAALIGCTSVDRTGPTDPRDPLVTSRAESQVGESFTLSPGEERSVPSIGLVVRFVDVPADHRCPLEVDCVWEGDAEVVAEAIQGGEKRTFRLHTPRDLIGPTAGDLASGHRLELLRLQPERIPESGIPLAEYRATFRVSTPQD